MRPRRFPRRPPPPVPEGGEQFVEPAASPRPPGGNPWIVVALLAAAVVAVGIVALFLLAGRVKDRDEERITVSEVPPVLGLGEEDAVARVRQAGFEVEVAYELDAEPAGTVVGQRPEGGVALEPGATVVVRVAAGEAEPER